MNHLTLDFSGLSQQFSHQELRSEIKKKYFTSKLVIILVVTIIVPMSAIALIILGAALYGMVWALLLQSAPTALRAIAFLLCIVLPAWGIVYLVQKLLMSLVVKTLRLQTFAAANKLEYLYGSVVSEPGVLFDRGHSRAFTEGFRFPNEGRLEIANYSYVEGSGKNSRTYNHGIIRCDVSRQLPNVLLDATSNNLMGRFSNLGSFSNDQRVELEGDFNKYFTVYCPAGYTTDTLYWLTPELMQLLKDRMASYDIEVIDNHVYAYAPHTFAFNEAAIREAFQLGEWLRAEFEQNTRRYADVRVASPAANTVAAPGRRLKRKFSWVGIGIILLYFLPQIINFIASLIRNTNT